MREILKETDRYTLFLEKGFTEFEGCQCIRDCTCYEDFVSKPYEVYGVKKKTGKIRTTFHSTMESITERLNLLDSTKHLVKERLGI